jgi:folate-binding protein YgfZ
MSEPNVLYQIMENAGLFDRSDRIRLVIKGPDRAKFLHNLLTNEIKRLPIGTGCEAFVTSTQGKTLAFVTVLAGDDVILLRSDAGATAGLVPHLTKYGVFDDVVIDDQSASTFEYHLAGPAAEAILRRGGAELPPESVDLAHLPTKLVGLPVRLIRESPTKLAGFTVIGAAAVAQELKESLLRHGGELGLVEGGPEASEVLRIEAGTPVFGKDITEKNLPQEIGRDSRAISFVKGCYLGQETVARLDALGHVNQMLKGLTFDPGSPCPEPGSALEDEGKRVGAVTSAAIWPLSHAPIALAFVRTSHFSPGTKVQVKLREGDESIAATVSDFPIDHPTAQPSIS